jgi:hypothetical protein
MFFGPPRMMKIGGRSMSYAYGTTSPRTSLTIRGPRHHELSLPNLYRGSTRISSPCLWATTKYENGGPVKVVILWNYEPVN